MKMKFIWFDKKNKSEGYLVIVTMQSKEKCLEMATDMLNGVEIVNWYEID